MKNQYFGDVNDYRKYGLLRVIQSIEQWKLLVAWMLTSDDGSRDGSVRNYLEAPNGLTAHDPALFAGLRNLLRQSRNPAVALIEKAGLLPNTTFFSEEVPDAVESRVNWTTGLLAAASGFDLVFVDPDNGIEVPSRPVGRKGSSKYVAWLEIEELWKAHCSILIYQHFPREHHETFADRALTDLCRHTGTRHAEGFYTANALFLLAAQERHASGFREVTPRLQRQWKGHIKPMGWAGKSLHPLNDA